MTFPIDPVVLTAFVLALVRAAAWLFVSPPFNTRMIPITVKAGIAAALALAAAPHIAEPGAPARHRRRSSPRCVTQALVGFTLGMFTMLLVNALQAAGSLVDLFAGFSLVAIYDPINSSQAAVFGRFYELLAITLLFTTQRVPHPRQRLLPVVRGRPRAAGSRSTTIADAAHARTSASSSSPRSRSRVRCSAACSSPRSRSACSSRAAPNLNVFALAFPLRVVVALIVVALAHPARSRPALGNLVRDAVAPLGALTPGRSATRWPPTRHEKTERTNPTAAQGGAREGPGREVARPVGVGRRCSRRSCCSR